MCVKLDLGNNFDLFVIEFCGGRFLFLGNIGFFVVGVIGLIGFGCFLVVLVIIRMLFINFFMLFKILLISFDKDVIFIL